MEDITLLLKTWYLLYERENPADVKQSIIFDYFRVYPKKMLNAALWLYSKKATPYELKMWICSPSFDKNLDSANNIIDGMDDEARKKLRSEFMISVNEAYVMLRGEGPLECNGKKGMLLC